MSELNMFELGADVEQQDERDTVGGFAAWESGLYKGVVKAAFLNVFAGGSRYIEVITEIVNAAGDTRTVTERETVWSAKTKGPYYIDKKDGKTKRALLGLVKLDSLGNMLCGKPLKASVFEEKVHKVYSKEAQGDVNTTLQTLTDWTGKVVHVGLIKQTVNKQVKQGDIYVDTAETREENVVDKYFNEEKQTNLEFTKSAPAEFYATWEKANTGVTKDKTNKKLTASAGVPTSGVPVATAAPLQFDN